jgi:predicted O-linked N-acetylglucosamine transferase (SPINDLY family)
MQRRFRAVAAEWHALADRGRRDTARAIRRLSLDLLIDLGGYGDQGLLSLCARRLAPVQIKWVGMQNHTTGMAEVDWFLSDRWETPPELAHLYTERLLLLPDGYVCYSPPIHAPPVAPPPAARRGAVTFGCFNNLAKITPVVVATWAAILRELPGARLVLKSHPLAHAATAEAVRAGFAAHGVTADRLDLRGGSGHRELLAEYGDVDMVLDPFPYSGGLTTCEALWMGVPVLTWPGELFASRHSASHLCNIGLADWVMPDLATYRAEAVRRARDPAALAVTRAGLRARMWASPLCDGPRFGRHLGQALDHAWSQRPAG